MRNVVSRVVGGFLYRPSPLNKADEQAAGRAPDVVTLRWLVIGLMLIIMPHLPRLPAWYIIALLFTAAERLSHEFYRRRPFPVTARLFLTGLAILGVGAHYGTILGRQAGVALLCLMIALKLLETYRRRDVYLLVCLSYFVALTQFLFSQSVYLVVYVFVSTLFVTGTLVLMEGQPSRVRGRRTHLGGMRQLFRNVGLMLLQAIPLMILMFLLVPRLSTPLWGMPQDALDAKTGVSGEMSPGDILSLFVSDNPAFRVKFDGPIPQQSELYWRGPVLWNFDGRTWRRPEYALRASAEVRQEDINDPLAYRVTMEPTEQNWIFGLDIPVRRPDRMRMQLDHMMYSRKPIIDIFSYTALSDPDYVIDPELSLLRRQASLELPDGYDPRTRELAETWRDEAGGDPQAIVDRALRFFNTQEFSYTLQPPPLARDTADDFLFNTRAGYCEHYSSVFTILMRAAGIPARVVTGYQGGWYNESGEYLLVRQSDAHAWSEVWMEGRGWVRVDPTSAVAPDRIDRGSLAAIGQRRSATDYSWVRAIRNRLDGIHHFWNQWVLQFNEARQKSLLQPFGVEEFKPQQGLIVLMVLGVVVLTVVGRWLLRRQWIGGLDAAGKEYAKFCRKLKRAGVQRHPGEGPNRFAERARDACRSLSRQIDEITRLYIGQRYAPNPTARGLDRLRQKVREFPRRP